MAPPSSDSPSLPSGNNVGLNHVLGRLTQRLQRDHLVQQTTDRLRNGLSVSRVVLYYFYRHWEGQVTFESLSHPRYSILGSTGPDECFNGDYAALYLEGRVRAIADIETADIHECHRDFLRGIGVRANLVVPVLVAHDLWGLLVAHHCDGPRDWSAKEVSALLEAAEQLANSSAINSPQPL
ncbi:MAG: GAF domain-containing protein [Cyanobacteria bacterium P01_A01_bin.135]